MRYFSLLFLFVSYGLLFVPIVFTLKAFESRFSLRTSSSLSARGLSTLATDPYSSPFYFLSDNNTDVGFVILPLTTPSTIMRVNLTTGTIIEWRERITNDTYEQGPSCTMSPFYRAPVCVSIIVGRGLLATQYILPTLSTSLKIYIPLQITNYQYRASIFADKSSSNVFIVVAHSTAYMEGPIIYRVNFPEEKFISEQLVATASFPWFLTQDELNIYMGSSKNGSAIMFRINKVTLKTDFAPIFDLSLRGDMIYSDGCFFVFQFSPNSFTIQTLFCKYISKNGYQYPTSFIPDTERVVMINDTDGIVIRMTYFLQVLAVRFSFSGGKITIFNTEAVRFSVNPKPDFRNWVVCSNHGMIFIAFLHEITEEKIHVISMNQFFRWWSFTLDKSEMYNIKQIAAFPEQGTLITISPAGFMILSYRETARINIESGWGINGNIVGSAIDRYRNKIYLATSSTDIIRFDLLTNETTVMASLPPCSATQSSSRRSMMYLACQNIFGELLLVSMHLQFPGHNNSTIIRDKLPINANSVTSLLIDEEENNIYIGLHGKDTAIYIKVNLESFESYSYTINSVADAIDLFVLGNKLYSSWVQMNTLIQIDTNTGNLNNYTGNDCDFTSMLVDHGNSEYIYATTVTKRNSQALRIQSENIRCESGTEISNIPKKYYCGTIDSNNNFLFFASTDGDIVIFDISLYPMSTWLIVVICICSITVVVIIVIAPFGIAFIQARLKLRRQRNAELKMQLLLNEMNDMDYKMSLQSNNTAEWIIRIEDLVFKERIAEGSFGVVFRGSYHNSSVAIKKIKVDDNLSEFEHEVKILKSLRHPNIVLFMGVCISDENKFIVTEFMEGKSLESAIHKTKKSRTKNNLHFTMSFYRKIDLLLQVAQGMTYLHNLQPPLCHRDLKPSNILLDKKQLTAKVCDFGTAKSVHSNTMTGNIGTLVYMSPEVLKNQRNYDEACDIYSFGIIMYEIFFETRPYSNIKRLFFEENEEECFECENIFNLGFDVINGKRPEIPDISFTDLEQMFLSLMIKCWHQDSYLRPSFEDIFKNFEMIIEKIN